MGHPKLFCREYGTKRKATQAAPAVQVSKKSCGVDSLATLADAARHLGSSKEDKGEEDKGGKVTIIRLKYKYYGEVKGGGCRHAHRVHPEA